MKVGTYMEDLLEVEKFFKTGGKSIVGLHRKRREHI